MRTCHRGILFLVCCLTSALANAASPQAACSSCSDACAAKSETTSTVRRSGSWLIEETENFSFCRPANYPLKAEVVQAIEKLRQELCGTWLPKSQKMAWNPKCHIVVHARLEGYLKEVGPGAGQTTGSSLIDFDENRIVMRRIDIRGDRADWFADALAHELTHVVLADRFTEVQIPHWADEGMAIQADPIAKRRLHGRDLDAAVASGGEFRLVELLTLDHYPHPSRMGAFYGQSASLVDYLTRIGTKEQLVGFVHEATVNGYDAALRNVYAISGVSALENQWRRHLRGLPIETISQQPGTLRPDESDVAVVTASAAEPSQESTPLTVALME